MSCDMGHRRGSDPMLLWLWRRPAATAPVQPLAWELPYARGLALKDKKKKKILFFYWVRERKKWTCVTEKQQKNPTSVSLIIPVPGTDLNMPCGLPSLILTTGSSHCGSVEMNLTSIHEDTGSIPGFTQWVKDPMLSWTWYRSQTRLGSSTAVATTPIQPLAWKTPNALGAAIKRQKKRKQVQNHRVFRSQSLS